MPSNFTYPWESQNDSNSNNHPDDTDNDSIAEVDINPPPDTPDEPSLPLISQYVSLITVRSGRVVKLESIFLFRIFFSPCTH